MSDAPPDRLARILERERAARRELEQLVEDRTRELYVALEELRAQKELRAAREQRLAGVAELAASLGHNMRGPLASVRNALAYLGKRLARTTVFAEDERVQTMLHVAERDAAVCGCLIVTLLDYARHRPLKIEPCDLRGLVAESISLARIGSRTRVDNAVPEGLRAPVDRDLFRPVLLHLIQNACDAIPEGQNGRVAIAASAGERITLTISDDGTGIPQDVRPHVFEPLFTTKVGATGLGLAIAKDVVARHGGTIAFTTESGEGTTFTVEWAAG